MKLAIKLTQQSGRYYNGNKPGKPPEGLETEENSTETETGVGLLGFHSHRLAPGHLPFYDGAVINFNY